MVSANKYICSHGAQINFGDLTPYLTYDFQGEVISEAILSVVVEIDKVLQ
jgi:hypothetical protein